MTSEGRQMSGRRGDTGRTGRRIELAWGRSEALTERGRGVGTRRGPAGSLESIRVSSQPTTPEDRSVAGTNPGPGL